MLDCPKHRFKGTVLRTVLDCPKHRLKGAGLSEAPPKGTVLDCPKHRPKGTVLVCLSEACGAMMRMTP